MLYNYHELRVLNENKVNEKSVSKLTESFYDKMSSNCTDSIQKRAFDS